MSMARSTEISGFLDGREYTASFLYEFCALLVGNGVYADELAPTANNDNMTVTYGSGHAWINGVLYKNTTPFDMDFDTADGALDRYDSIMLRLDLSQNEAYAVVEKGAFAASPTPPEVTRNAEIFDLKICDVYIPAGCTKITQYQVFDTRLDSAVCGVPVFLIEHLDTTSFYRQIATDLANFKSKEQMDFSEWEEAQKSVILNTLERLNGLISEDTVGSLINQINERVTKTGDTMTGPLDMGSNRVKNVAEPEADTDAATLGYARKVGAPYNLLDNSDFRNPVNQRGSTIFQAPNIEYWLDRWVACGTGSSFTLEEGKVVVSSDGTATCGLVQRVSVNSLKSGSKYTLAFKAKVIGAKCYLSYGVNNKDNAASSAALEENVEKIHTFTFTLPEADADSACYNFRIRSSAAEATMEIEWAALYEGEYTAETLPEYQPKGYAAELMECYRYFYKLINKTSSGLLTASGTEIRFGVETPIAMRTTPTLSSFEMSGLRTIVNTNIAPAVTDPLVGAVNGNVLALRGTVDLSEYIDSATYINNTPVAAYIGFELSADL